MCVSFLIISCFSSFFSLCCFHCKKASHVLYFLDLISKIIQLLQNIAVPDELNKLEKVHALSDGKHKKLITELIEEQQLLLADCLFAVASQYPFSKESCKKLMSYLKLVAPNTSDGTLDAVTIRVLLSLLASFNCDVVDSAINDDNNEQCKSDMIFLLNSLEMLKLFFTYILKNA